jgi:hypothetical protein
VIPTGGAPVSAVQFADTSATNMDFTPPQPGTFTIGLSVTDKDGNTAV